MKWALVCKAGNFYAMPFKACEFPQVCLHCPFDPGGQQVSLDFPTLPPSHKVYSLMLRGHLSLLNKQTKQSHWATDYWIPTSYQMWLSYTLFCEIQATTMIDTVEAQRREALQLKLPGLWECGPADSLCCLCNRGPILLWWCTKPHSLLPLS